MKVSVLMITYNHEAYIAGALNSVLMQRVNFDYEIVIGEDCSTDNTRNIAIDYQKKHPDKIRLFLPEKNIGMIGNFIATYKACEGEYVALLEGDDYWTSPDKLQRQVDFLDAHPECSECFHNVNEVYDTRPELNHPFHRRRLKKRIFTLSDIISHNFIPTCSTIFRNRLFGEFPEWFSSMPMGDWPLHVLNAEHGTICYMDEILAAHRVHEAGVWSGLENTAILVNSIDAANHMNDHYRSRFQKEINKSVSFWHWKVAQILYERGDIDGAYHHGLKCLVTSPFSRVKTKVRLPKIILKKAIRSLQRSAKQ
ncbi:MAG TPA: glycosyltransferase [Nitrospirota bacterium]|nr:glycosyltransferase [Thermodesulfovibrionales bacterium]HXY61970.1 glycosyltransferase [Nitrospirota bacterium]